MINSLLIFMSSLNKNRKLSFIFIGAWIIYLILTTNFELGLLYPCMSLVTFLVTALGINLFAKNKYLNGTLSVMSVLIWSSIVDVLCYYAFPMYSQGQTLLTYVLNGLMFNYKYIVINLVALALVYLFEYLYLKNTLVRVKNESFNSKK